MFQKQIVYVKLATLSDRIELGNLFEFNRYVLWLNFKFNFLFSFFFSISENFPIYICIFFLLLSLTLSLFLYFFVSFSLNFAKYKLEHFYQFLVCELTCKKYAGIKLHTRVLKLGLQWREKICSWFDVLGGLE